MTITRSLKPILLKMQEDPKYRRLRNSFDTADAYRIPFDELQKEIETLHKMREIRRLNTDDPAFVDQLIKANTNDQSIRGRITEIMMRCVRASSSLNSAIEALKHHLLLTHSDALRAYRTKEERQYVVTMALMTFVRYTDRVQALKELAQLVISDIDKGNWSIRTSIDALKLHVAKERFI